MHLGLDSDGFVVNESGANLQGYGADDSGKSILLWVTYKLVPRLLAQKPTEEVVFRGNLDARATAPVTVNELGETVNFFAADDPTSYNFSTTTTVYDSAGAAHQVTMYFYKDATDPKQYNVRWLLTTWFSQKQAPCLFDNSGALDPASATV